MNTYAGQFSKFGTTSILVLPAPVWTCVPELVPVSVQHRYRYRTLRKVKEDTTPHRTYGGQDRYDTNPVPPHCDIKVRPVVMGANYALQIVLFRYDECIGLLSLSDNAKNRQDKNRFDNLMAQDRFWPKI